MMESNSIHARHRRQVFFVSAGMGLFIMAGFTVVHYVEGNVWAMRSSGPGML